MVAQRTETRKKVKQLYEFVEGLSKKGRTKWRRELLDEAASVLSKQTLGKWPSLLKKSCEGDGEVMNNLYSVSRSGPLHKLHSRVSRPSTTFLN